MGERSLCRRRRTRAAGARALGLAVLAATASAGCAGISSRFDSWVLSQKAALIAIGAQAPSAPPSLPFIRSSELEWMTRPLELPEIAVAPLERHRIGDPALTQEELTFESAFRLQYPESDIARAYVYRKGKLGERPVVLWSPGQSTSDASFAGLIPYFRKILARDADVVFFVPPYHLERTPAGYASGDAFLATEFPDHLNAFAQATADMRVLIAWLRAQGVRQLGAMGSSMGSWILLRVASWDDSFAFLTVIVPVIRWELLMYQPEMAPIRDRLLAIGLSAEEAVRAYRALDPTPMRPRVDPRRISVFYGRYDRVAPEPPILEWVERWGVRRVEAFDRGHATMFFSPELARHVEAGIDRDLRALGLVEHGEEHGAVNHRSPAFKPVGWPMTD